MPGEGLIDQIYADPLPVVVDALTRYSTMVNCAWHYPTGRSNEALEAERRTMQLDNGTLTDRRPVNATLRQHTMFRQLLNLLSSPLNRFKMATWAAKVDRLFCEAPGTDEGFTQADIDRNSKVTFGKMSTWGIVCEEVLDTTHPRVYYEIARMELNRRGISDEEYQELRRFAWLTAGWLNYEKMLWDWCSPRRNGHLPSN